MGTLVDSTQEQEHGCTDVESTTAASISGMFLLSFTPDPFDTEMVQPNRVRVQTE